MSLAALPAMAGEPDGVTEVATFLEILQYGWQINLVLGLLAFVALFLVFHVLLTTRTGLTVPNLFHKEVLDDIASGDLERAFKRASENPSLLADTIQPGLRLHDHPIERIHQAMEGAGRRAMGGLRQEVTFLANIGVLSPMLGLLGTVLGLLKMFRVMGTEQTVGSKAMLMSGHIGEAMSTTAVGLIVGIVAMGSYYLCLSRLGRIGDEVEIAAEEVVAALGEMK